MSKFDNINETSRNFIIGIFVIVVGIFLVRGIIRSSAEEVKIYSVESGYNLYSYLGNTKEEVITALEDIGLTPQCISQTCHNNLYTQTYSQVNETIYGLEYELSMDFVKKGITSNPYIFVAYEEKMILDHWPNEKEQESIQLLLDLYIDLYGMPDQTVHLENPNVLFDQYKINKGAYWIEQAVNFEINYDYVTKTGMVSVAKRKDDYYEINDRIILHTIEDEK